MDSTMLGPFEEAMLATLLAHRPFTRFVGDDVGSLIAQPSEGEPDAPLGVRGPGQMWCTLGDTSETDQRTFGRTGNDLDSTCGLWHKFESAILMDKMGVYGMFAEFKAALTKRPLFTVDGHTLQSCEVTTQNVLVEFGTSTVHLVARVRATSLVGV